MRTVFWTIDALEDREAIYGYIESDNPRAALALDESFASKAERLAVHAELGRIGRVDGTRELVVHRSFILVYDLADGTIRILRVLHTAMQWPGAGRQP